MTYGVNGPRGFQPARTAGGYTYTGALNEYPITATNANTMFVGDPVSLSTLGTVQRCSVSAAPALGVFMGCKFSTPAGIAAGTFSQAFWPGNPGVSTGNTPVALVADDPNTIWTIQETDAGGASGTPLTQAAVGLNCTFVYTAGSTVTGQSAVSLNNAATSTSVTATNTLTIIGLDPVVTLGVQAAAPTLNGGQQTTGAFANWLVKLSNIAGLQSVRPV